MLGSTSRQVTAWGSLGTGGGDQPGGGQQVLSSLEAQCSAAVSRCAMTLLLSLGHSVSHLGFSRVEGIVKHTHTHACTHSGRRYLSSCPEIVSCGVFLQLYHIGGHGLPVLPHIGCLRNWLPRAQQEVMERLQSKDSARVRKSLWPGACSVSVICSFLCYLLDKGPVCLFEYKR